VPNIAAESLMSVTQILAIFSELFFKRAEVYFRNKTFFDSLLHCYQHPV